MSLTLPAIRCARDVWVLAAGQEKARAVRLALSGAGPVQVPAAGARGRQRTLFLLDRAAASQLPPQLNLQTPIPEIASVLVTEKDASRPLRHAMSVNLGFGGSNAALVFSRI